MEYKIEDMEPLTTVESPAFRQLINKLLLCPVQLSILSSCIDQAYDRMMKKKINETLHIHVVENVLMSGQCSFLARTVHYNCLKRQ